MKINTNTLKIIGIISMLIAHICYLYLDPNTIIFTILVLISRYTFLYFSFLLVIGLKKTRSIRKYLIRLFIFALISQLPFNYFSNGNLFKITSFNIIFTIFLTLISLIIYEKENDKLIKYVLIINLYFASLICDWGFIFMPVTFIFYKYKNIKRYISLSIIILLYTFIQSNRILYLGFLIPFVIIELVDNNKNNRIKLKYFFYLFYPIHLLLLRFIYNLLT